MIYRRYQDAFRARGFDCRFFPDALPDPGSPADLFVVQDQCLGNSPEKLGRPVIVEERQDSSMPIAKELAALKNVVRFFKPSVVRPEYMNIRAERMHLWLLDKETAEASYPRNRHHLTDEEIKKVRPGFPPVMLENLEPVVNLARNFNGKPQWQNRPIDALFVGLTSYPLPTLSRHRLQFCEVLRAIRGLNIVCIPNRSMCRLDHWNLLFQSKIVISPWGYGEICWRDSEAVLAGCVLIKPRTDFVQTVDNFLSSEEAYQPCEIDASDLEEKVHLVLSDEKYHSEELRARNRDKLLEWWHEDRPVNWWIKEVASALADNKAFSETAGRYCASLPKDNVPSGQ